MVLYQEAVQVSSYYLITFGDSSVAVYYHYDTGSVYLFDSHQRNEYGLPDPFGMTVLLSFSSIDEFLTYIYTAYSELNFEMTPIHFPYWLTPLSTERCPNTFCLDNGTNDKSSSLDDKKPTDQQVKQDLVFESKHLQFQSYWKKNKQLRKQIVRSKRKPKTLVNNETNFENGKSSRLTSEIFFNFNISDSISISPFVFEFCILDSSEIKVDFLTDINHCHEYEESIRVKLNFYCQSCERFLFVDQIYHISGEITIASVQYDRSSVLCNTCYKIIKEGKMPYRSAHRGFTSRIEMSKYYGKKINCIS